jgi:hypothetical protein
MLIRLLAFLAVLALLAAAYVWAVLTWSYSTGERAGWVQKFSNKGWVCKTWEGELAMVSMPGAAAEKFYFTVRDDAVAREIEKAMGKRVSLHYEEKVGIPTTCFGETRHFVDKVIVAADIPLAPGLNVPAAPPAATTPAAPPAATTPAAPTTQAPVPSAPAPAASAAAPR